ncbi:hypothetical protein BDQ12DRAFT_690760 [Crucibulum laeve]|uniref:Protein kinase domain-containing protein n=1 Tax=Crucibulum laeve TaxID=68775 RepID=A0A5C3LLH1_9AGAR|nr:hypothetical protein BDQ12DRAFT_690760 [Crucibulum laeve]
MLVNARKYVPPNFTILPGFSVQFRDKTYEVERVLQVRPISVVLVVHGPSEPIRRIIKIYPKINQIGFFRRGFQKECRAYRILRAADCKHVPYYYGCTSSLTVLYPPNSRVPADDRLNGEQNAIMLEYFDGELFLPQNATEEAAAKALIYLQEIHSLSICHGDIYYYEARIDTPRTLMLLTNGDVRWIDFEHSSTNASSEDLKDEMAVVADLIGPTGILWKLKQGLPDYERLGIVPPDSQNEYLQTDQTTDSDDSRTNDGP